MIKSFELTQERIQFIRLDVELDVESFWINIKLFCITIDDLVGFEVIGRTPKCHMTALNDI